MTYRRLLFLALFALFPIIPIMTLAQEVTPTADVACTAELRAVDELLDLWFDPTSTPLSVSGAVGGSYDVFSLGEPTDAATTEAIDQVTQLWVACTNAGDFPRLYALSTDDFARGQPLAGDSREVVEATLLASPVARPPESQWAFSTPHEVRILPDGRIGATFTAVGVRQPEVAYTMYIVFEAQDGAWLLDSLSLVATPDPSVPVWGYEVVDEFPHDPAAYTQGLLFDDGNLYEGTGLYGESDLREVDLETGEVLRSIALGDEYFGEGIAVVGDRIYQLTWREGTAFVYALDTFELLETFTYDTEGWGLAWDGERLVMSDGSSRIVFRDPETFEPIGHIDVQDGGLPVSNLNELEIIDGEIWANIYLTDLIARIDPATGEVTSWVDLAGLLPDDLDAPVDVLNGIAYEPESDRIIVTGKLWPAMFEIRPVPPS